MRLLVLLLCITSFASGQVTKFKTDTIEVYDKSGTVKKYKCEATFTYTHYTFMLLCKDRRVYDFLIPGTSFMDLDMLAFTDTGYSVDMNDSTMNVNPSDTTKTNVGIVYQTTDGHAKTQLVQYVDSTGIYLIKRDKTKIKFK